MDNADLSANAIYLSDKTNVLVCSICRGGFAKTKKTLLKPNHIESRQHIFKLERFNNSFDNIDDRIICKSCKSEVKWTEVQAHAASHKIVPWYEPQDKYEKFCINHMFRCSTLYHCCLCEKQFLTWYYAYVHLDEETHVNRMNKISRTAQHNISESEFSTWIAEGRVLSGESSIYCAICSLSLEVDDTNRHFKSLEHKEKKSKLTALIKSQEEMLELKKETKEPLKLKTTSMEKLNVAVQTPTIIPARVPRAMICNFLLEPNTESENNSPNKYEVASRANDEPIVEDDWYSINFPKIDSKNTILPRNSPNVSKQREHPTSTELSHSYVDFLVDKFHPLWKRQTAKMKEKKRNKLDTYCFICICMNYGKTQTLDHLSSDRHAKSLKKYGCENIVSIENTMYFCKCCDCCIDNFVDVYHHVMSKEHSRIFRARIHARDHENSSANRIQSIDEIEETKENDTNIATSEDPVPSRSNSTLLDENSALLDENSALLDENSTQFDENSTPRDENSTPTSQVASSFINTETCLYIVKQNAKKSFCQICDISELPIATKKIAAHTQSQRHILALKRYGCDKIVPRENGNYHCTCCNVDVENHEKIYLHVKDKKHMSSLVKVKQEARHCTKIVNRTLSPEENRQSSTKNFLSDYIANIDPTLIYGNRLELSEGKFDQDNTKQPELSSILTSMASEVSRLCKRIEKDKKMRQSAKTVVNWSENRENQDERNLAKSIEMVVCPTCGCSVLDLTQLHSHVAQHFHDDFVSTMGTTNNQSNSAKQETTTENHNGALEAIFNGNINGKTNSSDEIVCNGKSTMFDFPKLTQPVNTDFSKSLDSSNSIPDLAKLFSSGNRGIWKAQSDDENGHEDENLRLELFKNWESTKASGNSPRKINMKKVMRSLDFDDDTIYDLKEKLSDIELGFRLSLIIDSETIYCLICRKTVSNTLQNYYDHLWNVNHCKNLEIMEHDDSLFNDTSDQYSDLKLAQEYMEEISEKHVHCFICDIDVRNNDEALKEHIYESNHERMCDMMITNALTNYNEIRSRLKCDWYSVLNYWCVPCFYASKDEVSFAKHLESKRHHSIIRNMDNRNKKIMLDYCSTCSLLLCGYRSTYAHHAEISVHKWLERDGYYIINNLPEFARILLAEPDKYVNERIRYLDEMSQVETAKEECLVRDLVEIVRKKFPRVKAYTFGSRVTGLGSEDSDLDIFLDCRKMYEGNDSSMSHVLYFITSIHMSLSKHPDCWDVNELLIHCRSPIIRACHRATGLACDMSVEDGLAVENTKLIRSFNTVYPSCRKLTLILKQWLTHCDLSGSERITSYALCWLVIFYLQTESILPSVATLIAMRNKSRIIAGWETGVSYNFSHWEPEGTLSIKELMKRFFAFYADFDYRYDVACPLLGEILQKRDFVDPFNLPKEMKPYVLYMKSSRDAEPFRIDSAMCIQDPFDLRHNLTKAVSKIHLNRFRIYCSKSFDVLSSS